MRYLLPDEILWIHDLEIKNHGGVLGIRDIGLLHSVALRPKMEMMGKIFYFDLFDKAAALLEGIATYHVFADGNKRTAFICAISFLDINGYELKVNNMISYRFMRQIATKKKTIKQIAAWLKKNSRSTS